MKNPAKSTIQLLLILAILLSFFPLRTSVSASETRQDSSPVEVQIIESLDDGIDLLLSAPSYTIEEIETDGKTFDQVFVPGTDNKTEAGQAQLPIASTLIGVPPKAEISLEIIEDSPQQIPGRYEISLAPYPVQIDDFHSTDRWDYSNQISVDGANLNSLGSSLEVVKIVDDSWIRDQRVIRIEYQPFQYNSNTGMLTWHPNVRVKVQFDSPFGISVEPTTENHPLSNSPFEATLETALLNYDQAKSWRSWPTSNGIQTTPPETEDRYRIAIDEDGIYKLTFEDLFAVNSAVAGFDLSRIQMTNQGEDVAIYVNDGGDGTFGPGDTITFYGQRFYGDYLADLYQDENFWWRTFPRQETDGSYILWKPEFNALMLEKFTRENVYWLFEGTSAGLRMSTVNGNPSGNGNDPVEHYRATVRGEESNWWKSTLFAGEETWFWEIVSRGNHPYTVTASAPATTGDPVVLRSEFVSESSDSADGFDHHTQIYLNSNPTPISNFYWAGKSRYAYEHSNISAASILDGTNTFYIEFLGDAQVVNPKMYFDWFEIEYNRLFVAEDNAINFTSVVTGTQKYRVSNFSSLTSPRVLDITNPKAPTWVLNPTVQSGQITISLTHAEPISVVMATGDISLPQNQISFYEAPDWSSMAGGFDYVFITHADLKSSTQALANYRSGTGLSTVVIDVNDLYNEFNFGIYNPIAIKNFLTYAHDNWDVKPTYALIVGDGHWNFYDNNLPEYGSGLQFIPPNLVWVDPWQGEVDSVNLLGTVGTNFLPYLMIARLPVNSEAEIDAYRNKLVAYEAPHTPQPWEQNHTFVADLADSAGDFPAFADEIITQYVDPATIAYPSRIYEKDYGCVNTSPTATPCPAVNLAISDTLNITGTLIVNYIGHASVRRWSHEKIFTPDDYPYLTNSDQLPVILSMDCLDGYWSSPSDFAGQSMIEEIIRMSDTGSIGAFSPTGLGVSTGHDVLHKGFYDALMVEGIWALGAAARNAMTWLYATGQNQDLLYTFTVFGDPALEIRNPYGLSATPQISTLQTDMPGTVLTHNITIENTGSVSDTFEINILSNWTASLPYTTTAPISPGGQISVPIEITTPSDQTTGSDSATLTITSNGNKAESIDVQLNSILVDNFFKIFLPLLMKGN